jgi:hypothetical protein
MSDRTKKLFLIFTVFVPFAFYCLYYYAHVFKVAPYNLKEFKSFSIKYGTRDNMVNYYNSETGEYDYLTKKDSLKKINMKLTATDIDSLHTAARELGFWDFPTNEVNNDTASANYKMVPRYFIEYKYKRKTKQVMFDANFNGPEKLVDANRVLVIRIMNVLNNAERRSRN